MTTSSAEATKHLAAQIGASLQPGQILLLSGELGAGKTTFVQGLALGMEIQAPVTSPTFTLIHEYRGKALTLIHLDCYRLQGPDEVEPLGWFEILDRKDVVVVEWPERLGELTPDERLEITLVATGDSNRRVELLPVGDEYVKLVKALC